MPWNAQIDVWNAGCMVINDHPTHLMSLVDKSIRSGISLKAEICSVAQFPSMSCTVGGSPCRDNCPSRTATHGIPQSGETKVQVFLRVG
jgi:hypothetical protein